MAAGTLWGEGPGQSGDHRLQALINMLEAADALLENGDTAEACAQLWDAYHKVDGDPRPPDFVAGPAAPELAAMLLELITDLARG